VLYATMISARCRGPYTSVPSWTAHGTAAPTATPLMRSDRDRRDVGPRRDLPRGDDPVPGPVERETEEGGGESVHGVLGLVDDKAEPLDFESREDPGRPTAGLVHMGF